MTIKTIEAQIKKLQKELEILRTKKLKTFKIAGLEITEIKDWNKPYNEIEIPKGFRLPTIQEMFDIFEEDVDKWLGDYKVKYNLFWCSQTRYDKLNKRSRWVFLNRNSNLNSYCDNLEGSYGVGRVAFVRCEK